MKVTGNNKITFVNQNPSVVLQDTKLRDTQDFAKLRDNKKASFQDIRTDIQEGDFVGFEFRHLSATIVGGGGWQATDFSNERVLRRAVGMLAGKPAYENHIMEVGNEVGYVGETRWTRAYTNAAGEEIPAGIDGPFVLDKVLQPELIRKMSAPNPYVKSASVTVLFNWEASHDFEDAWDFYLALGEMREDADGEMSMVRRVVTEIIEFYESSLVWLGADPYAGILDANNQVQFIDKAGVSFSKNANLDDDKLIKLQQEYNKDSHYYVAVNSYNQNSKSKDMDLLKQLAQKLGKEESEITGELISKMATDYSKFEAAENELTTLKSDLETKEANWETEKTQFETTKTELESKVESLENSNATLSQEKTEWETEKATLESSKTELETKLSAFEGNSEKLIEKQRENTIHFYKQFAGEKPSEAIIKSLEKETNIELLKEMAVSYGGKALEESFSATCTKCESSEHIRMRSSIESEQDDQKKHSQFEGIDNPIIAAALGEGK